LQDLGGCETLLAEGPDGEGVVTLCQTDAVLVGEEMGVKVRWGLQTKSALEQDLASGRFEEVMSADYFSDVCIGIIDHAG
jgi:hypothetical protein